MAVKFYSDLLNTYFDNQEDAEQAEKDYTEQQKEVEEVPVEAPKNEKKALAKKISELDDKVAQAQAEYDNTKKVVSELYEEKVAEAEKAWNETIKSAKEDANKILKEAKEKVNAVISERYSAICEFNDKFGPYTKQYSGKKAYDEFVRCMQEFNDIFKSNFGF